MAPQEAYIPEIRWQPPDFPVSALPSLTFRFVHSGGGGGKWPLGGHKVFTVYP